MTRRLFLLVCVVVSLSLTGCYYPHGSGYHGIHPGYSGHFGHHGHH